MAKMLVAMLTFGIFLDGSAYATIYKYMDDNNQVNYTNVLSSIPVDKLTGIIKFEEYESETAPARSSSTIRKDSSPSNKTDSDLKFLNKKKREQKKNLMTEYNTLLKEKKDLDNNKSFQKRKKKRKYKNRPYIQKLLKKEEKLLDRIGELEAEFKIPAEQ